MASGTYVVVALICVLGLLGGMIGIIAVNSNGNRNNGVVVCSPATATGGVCQDTGHHEAVYNLRRLVAEQQYARGQPCHVNNGDESRYAGYNYFASYSKGLLHDNVTGEVVPAYYVDYVTRLTSQSAASIAGIALAPGPPGGRKLDNPQGGLAFDLIGNDARSLTLPPAPRFDSDAAGAELIQLYWMALLRDVPFDEYDTNPLAASAAQEMGSGPSTLFRGAAAGCTTGPYISQFLYLPCDYGANTIDQTVATPQPGEDYMTDMANYVNIQNGRQPLEPVTPFGPRRYMATGRDLAHWVHIDVLWQAYFMATLQLMGSLGVPANPTNPYIGVANQRGFATFGGPHFATLVVEVATRALHTVWYQKWFNHRRQRPEAYAARVHVHKAGIKSYPLPSNVLNANATALIYAARGTWLLPQAFPEGSPLHPAYGAGHATVAGACTTIVKALFDGSALIPNPMMPDPTTGYTTLIAYNASVLTVNGELNKLAANVALGRNIAGVHYESDGVASLLLGEQVAIETLRDIKATFNEPFSGWSFVGFAGNTITI